MEMTSWLILSNSNKMRLKILNKILTKIRSNNMPVETPEEKERLNAGWSRKSLYMGG
jgi:hypothetical protein